MDLSYDLREYSDPDECYLDRLNSSDTYPIVQHHTIYKDMNNKEKIQIPSPVDIQIRDLLIENHILDNPRIVRCGKSSNKVYEGSWGLRYKPYITFCGRWECRVCRSKLIEKQRKHHFSNNIDFISLREGKILLLTLTVPHCIQESLSFIYSRFKSSLSLMKGGWGWKKLKKMTSCEFHYDTLEITHTDNGKHLHNHITYGVLNPDVSNKTIKDILFDTWSYYTSKMGFRKLSKKGIDVTDTFLGSHSGSRGDKTVEELTKIKGTLEYWEKEYLNSFPNKTSLIIGDQIMNINRTFKGSRRGRIWTNGK
jgi:hypothetical protein